jgi:hypothetical protein
MGSRHAAAALAAAAAIGVTGCGSSSSGGGLSRSALASKMNTICTDSATKVKAIQQPADLLTNKNAAGTFFRQISAVYDTALSSFRALKPASDVQADYNTVITRLTSLTGLLHQVEAKAVAGDRSGIAMLSQVKPTTDALNAAAGKIGATGCNS